MVDITLHGLTADQASRVCAVLDTPNAPPKITTLSDVTEFVEAQVATYSMGARTRYRDGCKDAFEAMLRLLRKTG